MQQTHTHSQQHIVALDLATMRHQTPQARQEQYLFYYQQLPREEQVALRKIIRLAQHLKNQPIHIVMAMAKAHTMPGLYTLTCHVLILRTLTHLAKRWKNPEKHLDYREILDDFFIAAEAFRRNISLTQAQHRRRLKLTQAPSTCYQGRPVVMVKDGQLYRHICCFKASARLEIMQQLAQLQQQRPKGMILQEQNTGTGRENIALKALGGIAR